MKEYIKPEAKLVEFESEKVTADFEGGSGSNTLGDEWT